MEEWHRVIDVRNSRCEKKTDIGILWVFVATFHTARKMGGRGVVVGGFLLLSRYAESSGSHTK